MCIRDRVEFLAFLAQCGVQIIVETHSDHIYNGIRKSIRLDQIDDDKVSIYSFEQDERGCSIPISIPINANGKACLLYTSEIILLDEPTKGLDGFYKKKLAQILKGLTAEGKTILMVSHDIEFCAEYGDTCALFFHGSVVTSAPAREFFAGNSFYTTTANRMARKWYPDAVTAKDVIERCRER